MKLLLPIELEEVIFFDDKGKKIKGITGITAFENGVVVYVKGALYTNVESLLKKKLALNQPR